MTLDEFFTALTLCKERFTWTIRASGRLRGHAARRHPYTYFCPKTAVTMDRGQFRVVYETDETDALLELSATDAHLLREAADRNDLDDDPDAAVIRMRLLACLGLEEVRHGEASHL